MIDCNHASKLTRCCEAWVLKEMEKARERETERERRVKKVKRDKKFPCGRSMNKRFQALQMLSVIDRLVAEERIEAERKELMLEIEKSKAKERDRAKGESKGE